FWLGGSGSACHLQVSPELSCLSVSLQTRSSSTLNVFETSCATARASSQQLKTAGRVQSERFTSLSRSMSLPRSCCTSSRTQRLRVLPSRLGSPRSSTYLSL